LRNFERGTTVPVTNNLAAIRTALAVAGVEFIAENGGAGRAFEEDRLTQ
jgi:hypothetical protein